MNVGAVHRFHQSQRRLLEQTYDLAWQQGVHSYEPDEDPATVAEQAEEDPEGDAPETTREERGYRAPTEADEEQRARALAPAVGGVQAMVGELLNLAPGPHDIEAATAAARAGEILPEEVAGHAERLAINDWIESNAWRLSAGESVAWAAEQQGYAQAAEADGQLIEWLPEADGHVCEDCEALGDLPPMPLGDWPTRPGDGDTVCNVGCRCVLQVADDQELVDLNAKQEELISDLAGRREPSDWEHALPAPPPETRTPPPPPPPASPAVEHIPSAPAEINTAPEASAYLQSIGYDNIPINWGEKLSSGSAEATDALREVSTALRDAHDALGQRASQLDGIWGDSEAAKAGLPHSPMKESTWAQVLTRQGDPIHRPRTSDLVLNDRSLPFLRERWVDGSVQDTGHNAIATRDLYGRTLHEMGHTFMNNAPNAVPQVNRLMRESDFMANTADHGMTPYWEPWNLPYISEYATSSTQEGFAEVFATLMRPGGVEDAIARTERVNGAKAAEELRASLVKFRDGLNELHRNSPTVWPHIPTREQDALDKLAELAKEHSIPDPAQAIADPAKLWQQGAEVKPSFDSILTSAGELLGGKVLDFGSITPESNGVLLAPLKSKDGRGLEKVRLKYAGDFTRLKDIVRGTLVVPNEEDLPEALDAVIRQADARGWKVTGIENRFAREPGSTINIGPTRAGYRDLAMHLVAPDGHVAEVQINTAPLLLAKNTRGHDLYDSFRAIDEKPAELRTAQEQATWERGMRESKAIYDVAEAQSRPISYLNITPFTGKEPEAGFYDSARWHSFQSDLERVAKEEHVTIEGIDHVRGIWKGGGEPAARVILTDGIEGVRGVADRLGAAYDQEAVLRFRRDDIRGRSYRYVSDQPVTQEALDKAMLDSKLPGATLLPDGHVEVIDIGSQQAVDVSKLRSDLGVTFSYTRGDAELRADGKDYQRGAQLDRRAPAPDAGLPPAQPGEGPITDHVDRADYGGDLGPARQTADIFPRQGPQTGGFPGPLTGTRFGHIETVPVANLAPFQTKVFKNPLDDAMRNPAAHPITGVKLPDGTVIVEDGTHGAAAAILRGDKTVQVNVRELSDERISRNTPSAMERYQEWAAGRRHEYGMAHRPPGPGYGAPMNDLAGAHEGAFPPDIYDRKTQAQYYGTRDHADRESFEAINRAHGDPNALVTVYRAVPDGVKDINPGDWVTPSREYAEHEALKLEGSKVLSTSVPARELWGSGDSINEWGWHPTEEVLADQAPSAARVQRALVDAPKNPAPPAIVKGYMGRARREGLKLGTPEYAKRVLELAAEDGHDSLVLPEKEGRLTLKLLDPDKLSEFEKALQLLEPLPSEGEPYG